MSTEARHGARSQPDRPTAGGPAPATGSAFGPASDPASGSAPDHGSASSPVSGSASAPTGRRSAGPAASAPRFPLLRPGPPADAGRDAPPPPASARFPDAPPTIGRGIGGLRAGGSVPEETPAETTTRLRPIPAADDVAKDSGSSARAGSAASASAPSGASGSAAATASSSYLGSPARAGQGVLQQPSHAPGAGLGDTGASAAYRGGRPGPDPFSRPDPGRTGRVPGPSGVPEASGTPFGAAGGGSPDGVTPGGAPGRRPHPAVPAPTPSPDPALSWSTGGPARPRVSFGRPEFFDDRPSTVPARMRRHSVAAAVCLVLGLGLIGGAVTGAWLTGDSDDTGKAGTFTAAAGLWHNVPVDQLFPPSVSGPNAGPGGADRTWTRVAVAPDGGCADAFDPLLRQALAPVGCARLLRATYTDATQSYVTTVGLLFTKADPAGMRALSTRLRTEGLGTRPDLMPRPYAAAGTPAAGFGDRQRAAWTITVLTDAPVVVYAVSGWADGRTVDSPQPAPATTSGATTAPVQAGLGNEAEGLAGRIEKNLRHSATSPTETSS